MVMNLKKAFTLAEVLITLGIIGIVAAMTMPTLIGSYQKKVLETQYKRSISVLSNAVVLLMAKDSVPGDFGSTDLMTSTSMENFANELKSVLPTIKDVYWMKGFSYPEMRDIIYKKDLNYSPLASIIMPPAFAQRVDVPEGRGIWAYTQLSLTTTDGAYYGLGEIFSEDWLDENYAGEFSEQPNSLLLLFDTNGAKNPNMVGQDFFLVVIDKQGKLNDITCLSNSSCKVDYSKYEDLNIFDSPYFK